MVEVVFTLAGLNYGATDYMGKALRGFATADGRRRLHIPYPQAANAESILTGVDQLSSAIGLWEGANITVLGHSQGAEVASEWLEQYAQPDGPPPDAGLRFILIGNPCRRLGGVVTSGSFLTQHGFLGRRKPTPETQYETIDIARFGDSWANVDGWPTMIPPKLSFWQRITNQNPHTRYENVDIAECRIRKVSGNTTYLLAP